MIRKGGARRVERERQNRVPHGCIPPGITSRHAALRREQIAAARRLAKVEAMLDAPPPAVCRIAAARDRRSPFVYRPPRRRW